MVADLQRGKWFLNTIEQYGMWNEILFLNEYENE